MYVLGQRPDVIAEYFAVVASLLFQAMNGMPTGRDPAEWQGWQALAPHCLGALKLADDADVFPVLADPNRNQADLLIPAKLASRFLNRAGRYQELEEVAATLVRWQRRVAGKLAEETLASEVGLAYLRQYRGDHTSAEKIYRKLASLLPEHHPVMTAVRHNWASLLRDQGELDAAEDQFRAVLVTRRRELGDNDPHTLIVHNCLADIEHRRGNYTEASGAYESLLTRCRDLLGAKDMLTLAVQDNLALTLKEMGDLDAAEAESRAAVMGFTETLGAEHPHTLTARTRLGAIIADKGDLPSAEREFVIVLKLLERVLGPQHPVTTDARQSLTAIRESLDMRRDDPG